MVRRGVYDRPYLLRIGSASTDVALGGYIDLVGSYLRQDGVSEGFSFEARRFNIFLTSKIADYLRLTSELEFEHGTRAIGLETAMVDLLLHHSVNVRGGVLLVPLGKFNITHDSPLYDVIERPLVSTRILPATLSDVGGGLFGALYPGGHKLTYELYAVNGLSDGLIAGGGTRIPEGRAEARFEKDNNGAPALTGRVGYTTPLHPWLRFELGVSFYTGAYSTSRLAGLEVDRARWLHIGALDAEATLGPITLRGEAAYAHVDLPEGLGDLHAANQAGFYLEAVHPFLKRRMLVFERATLGAVLRLDFVDLNLGRNQATGERMGDETWRLSLGPSFRPVPATALRIVYRHDWVSDPLNNRLRGAGIQLGMATYF